MPSSIPAGPTTFQVQNKGTTEHGFEVEGGGLEKELDKPLKAGETGTLQVDLKPGSYKIYCPVADHDDKGMTMTLTAR